MRFLTPALALALVAMGGSPLAHASDKPPAEVSPALAAKLKAIVPANDLEASILVPPVNPEALAGQAVDLATQGAHTPDPDKARELRRRAYAFGAAATEAHANNPLLSVMMGELKPDGSLVAKTYSDNKAVSAALAEAETKFARGDMDGALAGYRRALELDPRNYQATLYSGDVYFSRKEYAPALEWFDRAIAIDESKETAHRYRGDVLTHLGRMDEAGASYAYAFADHPFAQIPTAALNSWVRKKHLKVDRPDSSFIAAGVHFAEGKAALDMKTNETQDLALSMVYGACRIAYIEDHKLSASNYRFSLAEELAALRETMKIAKELREKDAAGQKELPQEAVMKRMDQIDRDGLLEAFVFFDRQDQDIIKEYPAYRAQHHDQLVRYIQHVWLGLP